MSPHPARVTLAMGRSFWVSLSNKHDAGGAFDGDGMAQGNRTLAFLPTAMNSHKKYYPGTRIMMPSKSLL